MMAAASPTRWLWPLCAAKVPSAHFGITWVLHCAELSHENRDQRESSF